MSEIVRRINTNNYITTLPGDVTSYLSSQGTECQANGTVFTFRRQPHSHSKELIKGVSYLLSSDRIFYNIYLALTQPEEIEKSDRKQSESGVITQDSYRFHLPNFLQTAGIKLGNSDPFWSVYTDTLIVVTDFSNKDFHLVRGGKWLCDARTVTYYFKYLRN